MTPLGGEFSKIGRNRPGCQTKRPRKKLKKVKYSHKMIPVDTLNVKPSSVGGNDLS